uniref:hypothetical protein n=1 Tax=Mycolicibacter minnesotensis TaxID=1118379 RepID=UPI0021F33EE9
SKTLNDIQGQCRRLNSVGLSKTLNDIQGQCRRLNSVGLGFQKPTECSTIPLPTVTAAAGLLDSGRHHVHYMR